MLAQFVDGGVVIPPDLIGKRQVGGIEDARLCPEQLEQAGSFLDREARIRALPQRAVKQQDARRWLVGAETFRALRKALAHAWNQDALVKISWQNARPAVEHPLGPVKDCGDVNYRGFDIAKAKEYIEEWKADTGNTEVPTIVMIHTTTPRGRELGEIYQQTAKAAGIPLELQPVDQSTLVKRVFTNDFDISGWRIADGADMGPQLYAYAMPGSSYNLTGFDDPKLAEVAEQMRVATTREERLDLQCEMVSIMNDDGGILYRGGGRYHAFTTPRVKGVPAPYRGAVDVTRAWIDEQS